MKVDALIKRIMLVVSLGMIVDVQAADLDKYPHAKVLQSSIRVVDEYILALDDYVKVGGVWRNSQLQRVAGHLESLTLELLSGHTYEEGFAHYAAPLEAAGAQVLFACEKRDCGTSNSWANNHFKVIQLYGLDQFQRYAVYKTEADQSVEYNVIYSVRRGNGRVYVQVERLSNVIAISDP